MASPAPLFALFHFVFFFIYLLSDSYFLYQIILIFFTLFDFLPILIFFRLYWVNFLFYLFGPIIRKDSIISVFAIQYSQVYTT